MELCSYVGLHLARPVKSGSAKYCRDLYYDGKMLCIMAGTGAILLLFVMIALAPPYAVYDEPFYIRYAQLIDRVGLSKEFLNLLPGTPGPLVAVVQYAAKPLTGIAPPGIRLLNAFLFLICIGLCAMAVRASGSNRWTTAALSAIAIPVMWPGAGLGLSDAPAWVFVSLSVYCLVRWLRVSPDDRRNLYMWGSSAGLSLGIAALGRQNSLAIVAFPIIYALAHRRYFSSALVLLVTTTIVVAPVFLVWKGISPPSPLHVNIGLSLSNGILAFAYIGMFLLLLAPRFYWWRPYWIVGSIAAGIALNEITHVLSFAPMSGIAQTFGSSMFAMYRAFVSGAILALALYSITFFFIRLWENRASAMFALGVVGSFSIALSGMFVSGYSSRYTALGLPLFILISDRYSEATVWKAIRIVLGATLGALSLWSYYQAVGWELSWDRVLNQN